MFKEGAVFDNYLHLPLLGHTSRVRGTESERGTESILVQYCTVPLIQ